MNRNVIATVLIGLSTMCSAHAEETHHNIQFLEDLELHNVSGERLRSDLSRDEAIKILSRIVKRDRLIFDGQKRERLYSYFEYLVGDRNPLHFDEYKLKVLLKRKANQLRSSK